MPTLVIVGDGDSLAGPPQVLAERIPGAIARVVKGSHLGAVADPAFGVTVVEFVTGVVALDLSTYRFRCRRGVNVSASAPVTTSASPVSHTGIGELPVRGSNWPVACASIGSSAKIVLPFAPITTMTSSPTAGDAVVEVGRCVVLVVEAVVLVLDGGALVEVVDEADAAVVVVCAPAGLEPTRSPRRRRRRQHGRARRHEPAAMPRQEGYAGSGGVHCPLSPGLQPYLRSRRQIYAQLLRRRVPAMAGLSEQFQRSALGVHQWLYEHTDGRIGQKVGKLPSLLLRTTGARTGKPRVSALVYGLDGDGRYVVVGSNGGSDRSPGWVHNVPRTPRSRCRSGGSGSPRRRRS